MHISCNALLNESLDVRPVTGRYYQVRISQQEAILRRCLAEQSMGRHRGSLCRDVSIATLLSYVIR